MKRIAQLGTGIMGAPMARNLASAGFQVTAWNRTRSKALALGGDGVIVAHTPRECIRGAELVIVMLSDGPATDELLFGPEHGIAHSLEAGACVVMMSSIEPDVAIRQADRLARTGHGYLDAPVSGGERGSIDGTLTIFAGGERAAVEEARPVLEALGRLNLVGPVGAGQLVKLANQMIVGITIEAVAEALLLIEGGGGDPASAFAALRGGFADSTVLRQHGDRMLKRDHVPGATMATQLKDLRMAAAKARDLRLALPLLQGAVTMFDRAAMGGERHLDHSAIHQTLRAMQPEAFEGALQ